MAHHDKESAKVGETGSGEEGMDVDLDNFMTLDSVGDVDEVEEDVIKKEKPKESVAEKKPKLEVNIGKELVKKIEVYYCKVCTLHILRGGESAVQRHCRLKTHVSRYVRYKVNDSLRKQAEKLHRINKKLKEDKKAAAGKAKEAAGEGIVAAGEGAEAEEEGEGLKSSEDADPSRCDKFLKSDKEGEITADGSIIDGIESGIPATNGSADDLMES